MRWIVTLADKEYCLEAELRDDGKYRVVFEEREFIVDLRSAGGASLWSVLIGHASYEAAVVRHDAEVSVGLRARQFRFRVESEQARNARMLEGAGGKSGPAIIKSVMPGRVAKILVREGEEVGQGTPLVILEAMKMENEIRSPSAGVVRRVHVQEGHAVTNGDVLVTID
jgi:biotin carboxyl carrier protein